MTRSRKIAASLALAVTIMAIYLLYGSRRQEDIIEESRLAMGTVVQIKVAAKPGSDRQVLDQAVDRAFEEIGRVEGVFSVYKKDSAIARINNLKPGQTMKVSDEVFGLIERSIEYSRKTRGAFDITVGPLVHVWRAAGKSGRMPSESEINKARALVGYGNIIMDKTSGTIAMAKDGMSLDLGGVAKGYATDSAVKVLRDNGVKNAIVNSGGDMYCLGARSKNTLWRVGIRHPRDEAQVFMEFDVQDKAVVTSGDYEKFSMLNGKRYSHIIDPRTGYPIGDNVISTTVVAGDAATADILATALCVLGREGLGIADSAGAMAAMIVNEGGKMKLEMAGNVKGTFRVDQKKISQ